MTQRLQNTDGTNTRLGVLEYKVDELKTGQDKLIELVAKISYVHIADYTEDKKDILKQIDNIKLQYVSKDSRKNRDKLVMAVTIAVCVALATTILNWVLKGGLSGK